MSAPLLITTFRRPIFLGKLLSHLESYDGKIYIWMNGPANQADRDLIAECCAVISSFDNLQIRMLQLNDEHFSSARSISNAITWFFQRVDLGIILEDDIIPSADFLKYANKVLTDCKNDLKIGSILGSNFVPPQNISEHDYVYRGSNFVSSWGWATWKNRWEFFENELTAWESYESMLPNCVDTFFGRKKWKSIYNKIQSKDFDAWDYKWQFACWKRGLIHLAPNFNMVQNIGFDSQATHTFEEPSWFKGSLDPLPANLDLVPPTLKIDLKADDWTSTHVHPSKNWYWIKTLVKKSLKSIL